MCNYILDDAGQPVLEENALAWAKWFEKADRKVARDEIGPYRVSTVFLGVDQNFDGGTPILWETMIFGPLEDEYQERYDSREAALAGHQRAVQYVRSLEG